jgi:hypothetical protein
MAGQIEIKLSWMDNDCIHHSARKNIARVRPLLSLTREQSGVMSLLSYYEGNRRIVIFELGYCFFQGN